MTNDECQMTNATAEAPRGLPGDLFIDEECEPFPLTDLGVKAFNDSFRLWGPRVDEAEDFAVISEPEVPPVPACVELAKLPKVRRAMTADEAEMVKAIRRCVTFPTGLFDKRFMRELPDEITEKQAVQVWRIFWRYRRQIVTEGPEAVMTRERKEELLRQAEVVMEKLKK